MAADNYATLLDYSIQILILRARSYRNLVVVFSAIGLGSLAAAGIGLRPRALAGLLLLLPAYQLFLYRDAAVLIRWRDRILDGWAATEVDLGPLRDLLGVSPSLPRATLEGMLDTLPNPGTMAEERLLSPTTRRGVLLATRVCDTRSREGLVAQLAGMLGCLVALGVGLWGSLGAALYLLAVLLSVGAVWKWRGRRNRAAAIAKVRALGADSEFDPCAYRKILTTWPWHGDARGHHGALLRVFGERNH